MFVLSESDLKFCRTIRFCVYRENRLSGFAFIRKTVYRVSCIEEIVYRFLCLSCISSCRVCIVSYRLSCKSLTCGFCTNIIKRRIYKYEPNCVLRVFAFEHAGLINCSCIQCIKQCPCRKPTLYLSMLWQLTRKNARESPRLVSEYTF